MANPHDHPFYQPLWRRLAIIASITAWLGFEIYFAREPLWMVVAVGFLAYAVWTFLITWPRRP